LAFVKEAKFVSTEERTEYLHTFHIKFVLSKT